MMRQLRNSFAEVMVAWHSWRRDRHARARRKWMERLPAGPPDASFHFPPGGIFKNGDDDA